MKIFCLMKRITLVIILMCSALFAQNTPPVVTNVDFNMRTDGSKKVDITYDVNDVDGQTMTVTIAASSDGGVTWNLPITQVTGAVGSGITNGTGKTIVWNATAEIPNFYSATVQIRISADDNYVPPQPCPGVPTVTYAGKTYNTVQIGSQCWLKENLDVGTMIQGNQNATNNSVVEKYCVNNSIANCNTYGGLYQWNEAMQYVTTQGAKGICPEGWHIPTLVEFQILANSVNRNSNALKQVGVGWGSGAGTNISGFSSLLGGRRDNNGNFNYTYELAYFHSSTTYSAGSAYNMRLYYYDYFINFDFTHSKTVGMGIRCIKD